MSKTEGNNAPFAYEGLDRVIHEKARLGMLTSLVAHPKGLAFADLKQLCGLTDGNLSRHLQVLQEAGLVEVTKAFEGNRPQTSCRLTRAAAAASSTIWPCSSSWFATPQKPPARKTPRVPVSAFSPADSAALHFLKETLQCKVIFCQQTYFLHVAIIMDGNGRWATRAGFVALAGHEAGIEALRRVVDAAPDQGIAALTVYAFSSDNWRRPRQRWTR